MLPSASHDSQEIAGLKDKLRVILLLLILCSIVICTPVKAETPKKLNILFVFSWDNNLPWQLEVERGFEACLKGKPIKPKVFYEYMDAGRFKVENQIAVFKDYLKKKYEGCSIDYVVYESFPAAKFFMAYPELFKNAKKFILNPGFVENSIKHDSSTVIPVNADYKKAAQELLAASRSKKIYLVAGATPMGKERENKFKETLLKLDPGQRVISLLGLPMNQLLRKVSSLKPDSVIFYLLIFKDGKGIRYIPCEAAKQLCQHAAVPVYSLWTSILGSGIVGGYLLSGELVGQELAHILTAPTNIKNADINKLSDKFNGFYYDWRQLNRWDINENTLPAGSKVLFKKPTFYVYYYKEIVAGSLIIIILVSLFWNRKLKKEIKTRIIVEENLQESEGRFRNLSDASFEGILIVDNKKIIDANAAMTAMFGYTDKELIGMNAVNLVSSEERDKVQEKIITGYDKPYEVIGQKKDGVKFPMEAHGKTYPFKGKMVRVTALRDLSEKKRAEEEIKTLKGFIPICANCKKIRDDKGYWNQIESYIRKHSEAEFTHSLCPECAKELYPELDIHDD